MRPESRDALRAAIAKARGWIDDIRLGRISSFAGIAERCGPGRTAHPPAGSPRLPVAPHHCGDRRWYRACGSHRHQPCQGAALFLDRAGAEHRIVTRLVGQAAQSPETNAHETHRMSARESAEAVDFVPAYA